MIFECTHQPLVAVREQYPTLFESLNNNVAGFLRQAAPAVASFIFECSQAGGYRDLARPMWQRGRRAAASAAGMAVDQPRRISPRRTSPA